MTEIQHEERLRFKMKSGFTPQKHGGKLLLRGNYAHWIEGRNLIYVSKLVGGVAVKNDIRAICSLYKIITKGKKF